MSFFSVSRDIPYFSIRTSSSLPDLISVASPLALIFFAIDFLPHQPKPYRGLLKGCLAFGVRAVSTFASEHRDLYNTAPNVP